MEKDSRIYVAGHTGLLGSGLCRALDREGYTNIVTRTHGELDLTDQLLVRRFFDQEKPEHVFLAAAMAGGIHRNRTYPAEMIYVNLAIQTNVIEAARLCGVKGFLFVASGCSYPRNCPMPMRPEAIGTGPLEQTNEPFAVAKIAGIRMCQACNAQYGTRFFSAIPATIYGPGDHFDANGHVVAALMARFHQGKGCQAGSVEVWGTGKCRREFIYVDDAAEAMVFLMDRPQSHDVINIGVGEDISIADLAGMIAGVVGYDGRIAFDTTRPDGMERRLMDSSVITQLGWQPRTQLADGLARTYAWYRDNFDRGGPS